MGVLKDGFFPQPPVPDLDHIQHNEQKVEQVHFPPTSLQEVRDATCKALPDKALGVDADLAFVAAVTYRYAALLHRSLTHPHRLAIQATPGIRCGQFRREH